MMSTIWFYSSFGTKQNKQNFRSVYKNNFKGNNCNGGNYALASCMTVGFNGSVLLPQDTPGYPQDTPRTHKYTHRYLNSVIFIMFLNQIRFIFIECVLKSNITIKILNMFCLSMNSQEINPGHLYNTIQYNTKHFPPPGTSKNDSFLGLL